MNKQRKDKSEVSVEIFFYSGLEVDTGPRPRPEVSDFSLGPVNPQPDKPGDVMFFSIE